MRHVLLLLMLAPALAFADADRYIVEGSTTGSVLSSANPELVFGQTRATLVAHTCAANSCTRNAPSAAAEGLELGGVASYQVTACLSTGTFSGTGTIDFYVYQPGQAAWSALIDLPSLQLTNASGKSGCVSWPVQVNTFRASKYRLAVKSTSVATSAAAPVLTVRIDACLKNGCSL